MTTHSMRELGLFGTYCKWDEEKKALSVLRKESKESAAELVGWLTSKPTGETVPVGEGFGFHVRFTPQDKEPSERKVYLPRFVKELGRTFDLQALAERGKLFFLDVSVEQARKREEALVQQVLDCAFTASMEG